MNIMQEGPNLKFQLLMCSDHRGAHSMMCAVVP